VKLLVRHENDSREVPFTHVTKVAGHEVDAHKSELHRSLYASWLRTQLGTKNEIRKQPERANPEVQRLEERVSKLENELNNEKTKVSDLKRKLKEERKETRDVRQRLQTIDREEAASIPREADHYSAHAPTTFASHNVQPPATSHCHCFDVSTHQQTQAQVQPQPVPTLAQPPVQNRAQYSPIPVLSEGYPAGHYHATSNGLFYCVDASHLYGADPSSSFRHAIGGPTTPVIYTSTSASPSPPRYQNVSNVGPVLFPPHAM
jgi:hypothetical protein